MAIEVLVSREEQVPEGYWSEVTEAGIMVLVTTLEDLMFLLLHNQTLLGKLEVVHLTSTLLAINT